MKRPLLQVAVVFVGGILMARLVPLPLASLLAASFIVLAAAIVWTRARPLLLWPLFFLAGWTNFTLHTAILSPNDLRLILGSQPELATVRGVLRETPSLRVFERDEQESWRTMARIEVTGLCLNKRSWQPAAGRMAVTTPGVLTNLFAGQAVEITGIATPPRGALAEGLFDYRAYLAQQGIYYQLKAGSEQDWQILSSPPAPPLADRFCAWARQALGRGLPVEDESLRLEWALTLGWKTALTEEVSEPFVRAATYHIFAVDGLRMAIIFGIFFGLFRVLGLPRAWCGVLLIPLIWFYVALTGWPASAIRAAVMLTVVVIGWALKRPSDLINSLMAAALIILIWEPQQLFQAGFQLSFFVVLCMILLLPRLYEAVHRLTAPDPLLPPQLRRTWPPLVLVPTRYMADLALTSFAAWIGCIPLVAYYFNIITPVSTPANVLAVPLCALVLISNLASLALAAWFPAGAELFNHAGWFLMECIRVSSHWFADWPVAFAYVTAPGLFTIGLYYTLLLAALTGWLFKPALRAWRLGGAAVAVLAWTVMCWHEHSATRLTILPDGGSAVYLDAPGAKGDCLIDCGASNSVQLVTKPFLRAQGVNRLPALLLTHGDMHHIGGCEEVASLFAARQICASPLRFRSPVYRKAITCFNQTPGWLRQVGRGDAAGAFMVLHPEPTDRFSRADDGALVLMGKFCGTRVLLLSDLGRAGQDALLARTADLRADIVVTGLPVSGEPVTDALLDAIQPRVIIVADSEFPVSERASGRLRERLARRGVPLICTRSSGAATIEFRPGLWEIRGAEFCFRFAPSGDSIKQLP